MRPVRFQTMPRDSCSVGGLGAAGPAETAPGAILTNRAPIPYNVRMDSAVGWASAILVLVGRYGLSTSWPYLFRPSPQHGAAMDGRN